MPAKRKLLTILLLSLALLVLCGSPWLRAKGKQPKNTDGSYRVTIGGTYVGTGTADVKNKKVVITATVKRDGAGPALNFRANNLKLDGDHLAGTARVQGKRLDVVGRLDGYSDDPDFRGARVLCTYTDGAGEQGRVAGVLQ